MWKGFSPSRIGQRRFNSLYWCGARAGERPQELEMLAFNVSLGPRMGHDRVESIISQTRTEVLRPLALVSPGNF